MNRKNRNYTLFFILLFETTLINGVSFAQDLDSIKFKCTCENKLKRDIEKNIFFKKKSDTIYILNFNIMNSLNDTLILNNSIIYLKKIIEENILFDFDNSKIKHSILSNSGLGFEAYYIEKFKKNKTYYYNFGFHSFVSDTPFITRLVISKYFDLLSFVYFDSNTHFNCHKIDHLKSHIKKSSKY